MCGHFSPVNASLGSGVSPHTSRCSPYTRCHPPRGYASCSRLFFMSRERGIKRRRLLAVLGAMAVLGLVAGPAAQTRDGGANATRTVTPLPSAFADSTWIEMRNVLLHIDDRGVIRIERLRG